MRPTHGVTQLATLGGVLALFSTAVLPAEAARLTEQQFRAEIVGGTLVGSRFGLKVRLSFRDDGSVLINSPRGPATGTWSFKNGEICTLITSGPRKGGRCGWMEKVGDGQYRNKQGRTVVLE